MKLIKIRNKRLTQINKEINGKFLLTDSPLINLSKIKKKKEKEKIKDIVKTKNLTEQNKYSNLKKKITKSRKNLEDSHKNGKSTNISLNKNKQKKNSIEMKNNLSG